MSSLTLETLIIILIVLLFLSAFFSGSETALMSVNKYKLKHRVKNNEPSAVRLDYLLRHTDKTLGLILLLNNFVNILASAITTIIAIETYGDKGVAIGAGILTFMILVFSEVTPKTFASRYSDIIAYKISFIFYYSLKLFSPVVIFISIFSNFILSVFSANAKAKEIDNLSNEEIKTIVKESSSKITENYEEMVLNLLDLQKVTVEQAMIPKNEVEGIDLNDDIKKINDKLININHTRMPIYLDSLNNLKGFLNKKHIPSMIQNNDIINIDALLDYVTEPYFIPEDTSLLSQLITFKKEKKRIGCVVDEYGDIKGILTLDDILEEIVGEYSIVDDKNELIKHLSQNKLEIHGSVQLRDINKKLAISLSDVSVTTINGFILESLQEIPKAGMTFKQDNIIIEILEVNKNFVEKAIITVENE